MRLMPGLAIAGALTAIAAGHTVAAEAAQAGARRPAERVSPAVRDALLLQPAVRVMVAFAPVAADRLDAYLAAAPALPDPGAVRQTADELLRRAAGGFELRRRYRFVNALAGRLSADGLAALLADPRVLRVDLDQGGTGTLPEALPLARLTDFQAEGWDGEDRVVGVLDSGYDTDHPDLSDDLVAESCFCSGGGGCCPGGGTTQTGAGSAEDDHGHGTNVTGIITSKGTVAPAGGAPKAGIVAVKVLDSLNGFCCSSDVVAGLDWILDTRPDVDVVNMSLGTFALFSGDCDGAAAFTMAFATAIDALRARQVPVIVASGNNGSGTQMPAPACVANSISVGAVWDSNVGSQTFLGCIDMTTAADQVTCFSNSNSTTDLFAPGAFIISTGLGGGTSNFGGTSQAAPMTAACAALLLDKAPGLTADQVEAALETSATMVTDASNGLSFPRLDCLAAGEPCTTPLVNDVSTTSTVFGNVDEVGCNKIVAGPYPIGATGVVTFLAGEEVEIKDDFSVAAGGELSVELNELYVPSN